MKLFLFLYGSGFRISTCLLRFAPYRQLCHIVVFFASVIDDSALDYEDDEESSIAINPADEDTLLGDDGDEAVSNN